MSCSDSKHTLSLRTRSRTSSFACRREVAEREKDSPAYVHDRVEVDTNKHKHRPEAIIDHNDNETTNTSGGAVIREMFGCLHCIRYHFIKQVLSWV